MTIPDTVYGALLLSIIDFFLCDWLISTARLPARPNPPSENPPRQPPNHPFPTGPPLPSTPSLPNPNPFRW